VLEQVGNEALIQGSYKTAIKNTLRIIKTRASQEEKLGKILGAEKGVLTGYDLYVPDYGLTARKI
jgi:hypothetical protein